MSNVVLTRRNDWIVRMKNAGTSAEACWQNFRDAATELANVAMSSSEFSEREKKAAVALELVCILEGRLTRIMRNEFPKQYKVLGAPGDFGYDSPEGRAMQAVYECWNCLLQAK
ncbi:MAG: hypothetical protein E6Q97_09670 [Desulfurellales bacterium]|nr:MAG: hypothetical protein E6Q97_09670 [Desulfurellales bacterium]